MTAEPDDAEPGPTHYFDEAPDVASEPVLIDVTLHDTAFVLETDRGVFSRGRLDAGTALLLRSDAPLASAGAVLDLGCGAGPIALTMARRSPEAEVWAVDVNDRARELTCRNAARNGLHNIHVAAPDEVPPDLRFATIWSNPPVRIGKGAMRGLLSDWLGRLGSADGTEPTATLVVQKHLGADSLQRWLVERGHPTERVASKSGFRLLRVRPAAETRSVAG